MILMLMFLIGGAIGAAGALFGRHAGRFPFFPYVVIAVSGSLLGGFVLADALGHEPAHPGDLDPVSLLLAALGAAGLLALFEYGAKALGRGRIG